MKYSRYFRLPFLTRISGGHEKSVYLDRVALTPYTLWGQLLLHVFYRGDADQDPHDHPFDFWTMPFTSYTEMELDPATGDLRTQEVRAWRWHRRPAEHTHRALYRTNKPGGVIFTLVWRKRRRRSWGFWERDDGRRDRRLPRRFGRVFVSWRAYLGLPPDPAQSPDLWQFDKQPGALYAWHPELPRVSFNLYNGDRRLLGGVGMQLERLAVTEYCKRRNIHV